MSENNEIAQMFHEATEGIRNGLRDVVKAHVATMLGGEFSVRNLAKQVFENDPDWRGREGEKWIDATLRVAVEKRVETFIDELIGEKADELREMVKSELAGKDIAGVVAKQVVDKLGRL